MPIGTDYKAPALTVQEAWDVAAYVNSKPHPIAPPEPEAEPKPEPELDLEVDSGMQQGQAPSP
jgi:cytochrome c